jgi:hypothetical protein
MNISANQEMKPIQHFVESPGAAVVCFKVLGGLSLSRQVHSAAVTTN